MQKDIKQVCTLTFFSLFFSVLKSSDKIKLLMLHQKTNFVDILKDFNSTLMKKYLLSLLHWRLQALGRKGNLLATL